MSGAKNSNESIQVFVRCRPLLESEKHLPIPIEVHAEVNKIIVRDVGCNKSAVKTFTFDKVFGPDTQQVVIYNNVAAPLIQEVIMGFNCTILAYGQTGTGKTFTIEGGKSSKLENDPEQPMAGIIPRAMKQIFQELTEQNCDFEVSVSFLELYNEEIFDLLSKSDDLPKLKLYENASSKGSVIVQGLEVKIVECMQDVYDVLIKGCKKRRKAATLLNKMSSRSHTVFTVTVNMKESYTTMEKTKMGKLNMVDLAGSENVGRSGAVEKRAREAGNINQSLLSLGRVITALCENATHVPYRGSKLTRLLRDSLGGQTKTTVIATISPTALHLDETLNTLEYAMRAKNITNRPEINSQVSATALTKDYLEKIICLKEKLRQLSTSKPFQVDLDNLRNLQASLSVKSREKYEELEVKEELIKESVELFGAIDQAADCLHLKELERNSILSQQEELTNQLPNVKEEIRSEETILFVLDSVSNKLHEKLHEVQREKEEISNDVRKMEEKATEAMTESQKLQRKCSEVCRSQSSFNQNLSICRDNLLKKICHVQESIKFENSECERHLSVLESGYDLLMERNAKFSQFKSIVPDLAKEKDTFYYTLMASFQEEENQIRENQSKIETNIISHSSCNFDPLHSLLNNCEENLRSLFSSLTNWRDELSREMTDRNMLLKNYITSQEVNLRSLTDSCQDVVHQQQECLQACTEIITDVFSHEVESTEKLNSQANVIEDAIESLQIFFDENIANDIDKITLVHDNLQKLTDAEIINTERIFAFCESSMHSTDAFKKDMVLSSTDDLCSEIDDMRDCTKNALSNFKDLFPDFTSCVNETKSLDEFWKTMEESVADDKARRKELPAVTSCIQNFEKCLSLKGKSCNTFYSVHQDDLAALENDQITALESAKGSFKQLHEMFSKGVSENIHDIETSDAFTFSWKENATEENAEDAYNVDLLSAGSRSNGAGTPSLDETYTFSEECPSIQNEEACLFCENKDDASSAKEESGMRISNATPPNKTPLRKYQKTSKGSKSQKSKKEILKNDEIEKWCKDLLDNNWDDKTLEGFESSDTDV